MFIVDSSSPACSCHQFICPCSVEFIWRYSAWKCLSGQRQAVVSLNLGMLTIAQRAGRKGVVGLLVWRTQRRGFALRRGGFRSRFWKTEIISVCPHPPSFPSLKVSLAWSFAFCFPSIVLKPVFLITATSQVSSPILLSHPDLSSRRVCAREAENLLTEHLHTVQTGLIIKSKSPRTIFRHTNLRLLLGDRKEATLCPGQWSMQKFELKIFLK